MQAEAGVVPAEDVRSMRAHLVPSLDDVTGADLELEGLLEEAARGVED